MNLDINKIINTTSCLSTKKALAKAFIINQKSSDGSLTSKAIETILAEKIVEIFLQEQRNSYKGEKDNLPK